MGERGVRNAEVEGSIPFSSTSITSKEFPKSSLINYISIICGFILCKCVQQHLLTAKHK